MIQPGSHLLGLEGMGAREITHILDLAMSFEEILERSVKKVPTLRGRTIVNAFFEPSTRTRVSFELAQKRLSADVVNFSTGGSSLSKGETLRDTIANLEAMKVDMIVVRHSMAGVPHMLAMHTSASVVNAGDGSHEHPTQGLLDLYTMRGRLGDLAGRQVTIVGDIAHSRVARSNIWGLRALGAHVTVCGPRTMMPKRVEDLGVEVEYDLLRAIRKADAINVLRIQFERHGTPNFPNAREYMRLFGITNEVLRHTKPECFVMHPGPMNRGVEISPEVADGPRQVILQQVTNGVAVRMAVCYQFAGGVTQGTEEESAPPRVPASRAASGRPKPGSAPRVAAGA
ncbi:MAG: aspartate carbamoyltransferase catalytic subunit [Candidatus Latescibacterota bacterium]|nr:MAG: aspartate carbamoyltransferase catalytic subunit [Candidatus Latescibacterota bacterium]